jgi:hypothetical protein
VAQVVDGRWSIVDGMLRNDLQRYDRAVAIGDITWTDYEVTVPVRVNGFSPGGFVSYHNKPAVGVMLKWPGHSDWTGGTSQPNYGYYPGGGGGWYEFEQDGSGQLLMTDFQSDWAGDPYDRVLEVGTTYIWKVRVESQVSGAALYSMKVWPQGLPEPTTWELVDLHSNDVPGGSVLLIAHWTDVSFGDVVIDPL